jgi:hypothetical protein
LKIKQNTRVNYQTPFFTYKTHTILPWIFPERMRDFYIIHRKMSLYIGLLGGDNLTGLEFSHSQTFKTLLQTPPLLRFAYIFEIPSHSPKQKQYTSSQSYLHSF